MDAYDMVIIGAGQAGVPLAKALAAAEWRTALVERRHLGGSCVNFGCTPTKAALAAAHLAHRARRAGELGLNIPRVEVDLPAVLDRAEQLSAESRNSLEKSLGEAGVQIIDGHARFMGREGSAPQAGEYDDRPFRIAIGDQTILASQVVLDAGTRSLIPPVAGIDQVEAIHAGNWMQQRQLPQHLAVLGGGAVGLELAQFYRRMGSEVTVIDSAEHIAGNEDPDVSRALQAALADDGIEFVLGVQVQSVQRRKNGLHLVLEGPRGSGAEQATHLLVATGRRPNTDDLGLDTVGVKTDDTGYVTVDKRLATSIGGVWACGDIRGGPMFTHTAHDDFRVLRSQLLGDGQRTTERVVPYAVFTDPELGRVGRTEEQIRAWEPCRTVRFDMERNGRSREMGNRRGFVKLVASADRKRILGAAILGPGAGELVQFLAIAMSAAIQPRDLADAIWIHPTLAEAVQSTVVELMEQA